MSLKVGMAADGQPVAGRSSLVGYSWALRNRPFMFLWLAQVTSQLAQNAVNYALTIEIEKLTHSTMQVGFSILCYSLPSVMLGAVAGALVDRMDKRTMLFACNLLRAAILVGFFSMAHTPGTVLAVLFISSVFSQFFWPAEGAMIPLLVDDKELLSATSVYNLTFYGALAGGYVVLAPLLIKIAGIHAVLVAAVGGYALATILVALLPSREKFAHLLDLEAERQAIVGLGGQIKQGLAYISNNRAVLLAIGQITVVTAFLLVMGELAPGFTTRVMGLRAENTAYLFSPAALGLLAGSLSVEWLARRLGKERLVVWAVTLLGCGIGVLAMVGPGLALLQRLGFANGHGVALTLASTIFALLGLMVAYVLIPAQTVVQEQTADYVRGRVLSIQYMASNGLAILPLLFIGAVADLLGIPAVLLLLAVPLVWGGCYGLLELSPSGSSAPGDVA